MYKITPAGSLSSSQPDRPPCWATSLAFGLFIFIQLIDDMTPIGFVKESFYYFSFRGFFVPGPAAAF
jgi:hypothetical protein